MKDIRNHYSKLGVEAFYRTHGQDYENPHFPQIQALLQNNAHRIDYSKILDFCCGSGEVSRVLADMGFPNSTGCDPFTAEAYQRSIQKECLNFNFEDVIRGQMMGQFSAIICSFAMHLCPEKQLYPLVYQLFTLSPQLIIITPHKRPALETLDNVQLDFEDFVLTTRGKKVRLKCYSLKDFLR